LHISFFKKSKFKSGEEEVDPTGNFCRIGHQICRGSLLIEIKEESLYRFKKIDKSFQFKTEY